MALLEVEGLCFTYPGATTPTLQDVAFAVESGGSLALLGSSGAGKTTLLNLLSGLLPCTLGKIAFDGVDVAARGAAERGVAQVFQFPVLYDSLSVRDNIAFPLRTRGVGRRERRERAERIGELFDLSLILDKKPAALSLFQKQLTGFAKALVRDDLSMVLLDEPLTAVEPAMKWRLRGAVKRAQEELGVTMVYVTHDQTEALTFADTVSVLHGGKLLQTATPAELYATPAHSEVARFIGNPGMNLLPTEVLAGASNANFSRPNMQIGFRPEWASLAGDTVTLAHQRSGANNDPLMLSGRVVRQRLTGASADRSLGVITIAIESEATHNSLHNGSNNSSHHSSHPSLEVQVTSEFAHEPGAAVHLLVHDYQLFQDNWRVDRP